MIKDIIYDEFQNTVSELLICNRSILDLLSRTQEANARLNRSIIKSVTGCGCTKIDACKKDIPPEASFSDLKDLLDSHLKGNLCKECKESVEHSVGISLLYMAAICNILDLNMYDIILKQQNQLKTLGYYSLA